MAVAHVYGPDRGPVNTTVDEAKKALEEALNVPFTIRGFTADIQLTGNGGDAENITVVIFHETLLADERVQGAIATEIVGSHPSWRIIVAFNSIGPWYAKTASGKAEKI